IGHREPVDALEHQAQAEGELQLDDHGWLVAPDRDDVAAADLCFDVVALSFEEGLDRRIQVDLGARRPAAWHRRDSTLSGRGSREVRGVASWGGWRSARTPRRDPRG